MKLTEVHQHYEDKPNTKSSLKRKERALKDEIDLWVAKLNHLEKTGLIDKHVTGEKFISTSEQDRVPKTGCIYLTQDPKKRQYVDNVYAQYFDVYQRWIKLVNSPELRESFEEQPETKESLRLKKQALDDELDLMSSKLVTFMKNGWVRGNNSGLEGDDKLPAGYGLVTKDPKLRVYIKATFKEWVHIFDRKNSVLDKINDIKESFEDKPTNLELTKTAMEEEAKILHTKIQSFVNKKLITDHMRSYSDFEKYPLEDRITNTRQAFLTHDPKLRKYIHHVFKEYIDVVSKLFALQVRVVKESFEDPHKIPTETEISLAVNALEYQLEITAQKLDSFLQQGLIGVPYDGDDIKSAGAFENVLPGSDYILLTKDPKIRARIMHFNQEYLDAHDRWYKAKYKAIANVKESFEEDTTDTIEILDQKINAANDEINLWHGKMLSYRKQGLFDTTSNLGKAAKKLDEIPGTSGYFFLTTDPKLRALMTQSFDQFRDAYDRRGKIDKRRAIVLGLNKSRS